MPDYQPIDYRLRCHTKRTDLPSDVLRDIGEAYEYINDLQRRIQMLREGFEGSCTACEPVGKMNQKLREERDEARREVCDIMHMTGFLAGDYAASRGWDCFPDWKHKVSEDVKNFWKIMNRDYDRVAGERDEARREIMNGIIDQACSNEEIDEEYKKRGWSYLKKENTND
jgi:hypothetical protein